MKQGAFAGNPGGTVVRDGDQVRRTELRSHNAAIAQLNDVACGSQPERAVRSTQSDGPAIALGERGIEAMEKGEAIGGAKRDSLRSEDPQAGWASRYDACDGAG